MLLWLLGLPPAFFGIEPLDDLGPADVLYSFVILGMSSLIFRVMFSEVKTKAAAFGLVLPISLAGALAIFVTAQWWVARHGWAPYTRSLFHSSGPVWSAAYR